MKVASLTTNLAQVFVSQADKPSWNLVSLNGQKEYSPPIVY